MITLVPLATTINLAGQWATLWGPLSGSPILKVASFIAFGIAIFAVIKFLIDKQRGGGGGGNTKLIWTAVVCIVLSAPELMIPALLKAVDWVLNLILKLGTAVLS